MPLKKSNKRIKKYLSKNRKNYRNKRKSLKGGYRNKRKSILMRGGSLSLSTSEKSLGKTVENCEGLVPGTESAPKSFNHENKCQEITEINCDDKDYEDEKGDFTLVWDDSDGCEKFYDSKETMNFEVSSKYLDNINLGDIKETILKKDIELSTELSTIESKFNEVFEKNEDGKMILSKMHSEKSLDDILAHIFGPEMIIDPEYSDKFEQILTFFNSSKNNLEEKYKKAKTEESFIKSQGGW